MDPVADATTPEVPFQYREVLRRLGAEFEKLQAKNNELCRRNADLHHEMHLLRRFHGTEAGRPNVPVPDGGRGARDDVGGLPEAPAAIAEDKGAGAQESEKKTRWVGVVPIPDGPPSGPDHFQDLAAPSKRHKVWEDDAGVDDSTGRVRVESFNENSSTSRSGTRATELVETYSTYSKGFAVGQFAESEEDNDMPNSGKYQWSLRAIVSSTTFEFSFAVLILMNTLVMAMEAQYNGIDAGYTLGYPGSVREAADAWPGAVDVFKHLEFVFGVVFFLEVLLKGIALRVGFFMSGWNLFDMTIVILWSIEKLANAALIMNPMTLRVMRLARLVRLARMIKTVQALDSLQVLIGSIWASFSVLAWSSVILLLAQMLIGLLLHNLLISYIEDASQPHEERTKVYRYFGTFTRSMITMFELTLANWIPVCRLLSDNVSEWYGIFMLCYKLVMGFAVVKVITGVFLHETFRVASTDDELMIVQKKRSIKKHQREMEKLFRLADNSKDGLISRAEFRHVLSIPRVRTWLSAMELEVEDYDLLFDFMDDGDQMISAVELMRGVQRLKGAARSIDMVAVMRKMLNMQEQLQDVLDVVSQQSGHNPQELRR